jgi:hypothetical protein
MIPDNSVHNIELKVYENLNNGWCEEIDKNKVIIEELRQENQRLKNNWTKLNDFLEENWKDTQDVWFVKIINKMREIEKEDDK